MSQSSLLPLTVTTGEPAGIGPDIIIKAWLASRRTADAVPPFYVLGDARLLRNRAQQMGVEIRLEETTPDKAMPAFECALPVVPLAAALKGKPGRPAPGDYTGIIEAITTAVEHIKTGFARAIVTAPINKKALYDGGFSCPGHTEFLAEIAGGWPGFDGKKPRPVMMLAGPRLRAVPVTVHIALADVPKSLTSDDIFETATITAADLHTRFGIKKPRLAICGLNPHAGEEGTMGMEDIEIIAPAIARLQKAGIAATGPLPADTLFHQRARKTYDAAICMYHDQALIPAKALDFDKTVNVTLGLPFVRTSPDHGTAYDIAGSGKAKAQSMIAALQLADRMSRAGGA